MVGMPAWDPRMGSPHGMPTWDARMGSPHGIAAWDRHLGSLHRFATLVVEIAAGMYEYSRPLARSASWPSRVQCELGVSIHFSRTSALSGQKRSTPATLQKLTPQLSCAPIPIVHGSRLHVPCQYAVGSTITSPASWTAVHHCVGSPGTVGVARPSTCRSQGASSGCGMSGGARYQFFRPAAR
eukprot:CAMPEP_0181216798 /NCGR_PEP_ID=MMETSP1096-20121128/26790_1 /TAXON_ID=156174 ORGANISM="Chrysochromulina ericina, Strain CCMP281" /NCGR_SAMPLE_ID=MMETSP1096 /ASSEMBLY_ACC=CAM_ASM_000453 /LENGTH=182 /DNA_ID=CAMNT_0023308847 /DNA_START=233 /DNA_END=779 /DNA_ORIENTATION=-